MRATKFFNLAIVTVALGVESSFARTLEEDFDNPPQSAGVWAWWHWCGSNVSKSGITRDLEAMKAAGLGGATMFNIQSKGTSDQMENSLYPGFTYRNEAYWEMLRFATAEAKRLGLAIGAHNCTGYSTAGGPWIRPDQSMKKVVWTKAKIPAGKTAAEVELPQPETFRGFYRDIGRVTVGDTVYRFGYTSTGKRTHPAPPEMEDIALEADKMSVAAMNHHWDNVLGGFLRHVPPSNPGFTHILIDSYEAGPSNWTDDFREEFSRRRGYDPLPKLPALDGAFAAEENKNFKRDMDRTVSELYTERYYEISFRRVRASGYELHLEPYTGPFDMWEASARCDVPMTEFWHGQVAWGGCGEGGSAWMCGPVARALGRGIVGAESFTACPESDHWSVAPRHLKRSIDITFVQGINRMSLHHWVHQPLDPKYQPGFSMGFWGTHFGENQTWFEPGKAMYRYMQRCQAMMQRGMQDSDAIGLWYTEDFTDDGIGPVDFLKEVSVGGDGRITVASSGRTYPVMLLDPKGDYTQPKVLEKLSRLLANGAAISAPKGLLTAPPGRKGRLFENMSRAEVLAKLGIKAQFELAGSCKGEAQAIQALGRVEGEDRFYMVINKSDRDIALSAFYRNPARKAPQIWFPGDGRKLVSPVWEFIPEDGRTRVDFVLRANESAFVVFNLSAAESSGKFRPAAKIASPSLCVDIASPWSVSFQPLRGAPEGKIEISPLVSLSSNKVEGIKYFSGTATYETQFEWNNGSVRAELDLGEVCDIAEVELNGRRVGTVWYAPFKIDVTGLLKPGENRLVVKVANCWMNRLIGDNKLPKDVEYDSTSMPLCGKTQGVGIKRFPDWLLKGENSPSGRITFATWDYFAGKADIPLAPSGLVGPVRIFAYDEQ